MKTLILAALCVISISASAYTVSPEKKTILFKQIEDLRYLCRMDEYYLAALTFGDQVKIEDRKADLTKKRNSIAEIEKEYIPMLNQEELKDYSGWKQIQDQRDKSRGLDWWYALSHPVGC